MDFSKCHKASEKLTYDTAGEWCMEEALVKYAVSVTKIFYGHPKEAFMRLDYGFAAVNKLLKYHLNDIMQIQQQGTGIGDTNTIPNVRPMPNALARPLGKGRKKVKASLTTENEGIITLKDEERKKQEKSSKHVEKQGKKRESKTSVMERKPISMNYLNKMMSSLLPNKMMSSLSPGQTHQNRLRKWIGILNK